MVMMSMPLFTLLLFYLTSVTKPGMLMILAMTLILGKALFMVPLEEFIKLLSSYYFCDLMSISLIMLSVYLTLLMVFSSHMVSYTKTFYSSYCVIILLLLMMLLLSFLSVNFILFYFFFEVSLIPTLIIIMGWGYQPERLQAGIYFMLYTLTASLPLLMVILMVFVILGSLSMVSLDFNLNSVLSFWGVSLGGFSFFLVLAFLVKMPVFIGHLWLPKAHVEAPVAGSMILAGVLLKLGGYGICRVLVLFSNLINWLSPYMIGLSVMGMFYVGVVCCRLNDMKALVAYSSVAHMGLVLSGIFSFYLWGVNGGLVMMLSHGLVSSGLFCSVNFFYERFSSRSLFMNKGLLNFLPVTCLLVFLLCVYNVSAPPSINLLSEIFLMLSVLGYDLLMMLIFPLGSFLGAVFTFYMFSYSQHGSGCNVSLGVLDSYYIEFHNLALHIFPTNLLIFMPGLLMIYL